MVVQQVKEKKKKEKKVRDMYVFSWELREPRFFPRRGS
jgi:hypothetical protein